jgi:hypothetical protein
MRWRASKSVHAEHSPLHGGVIQQGDKTMKFIATMAVIFAVCVVAVATYQAPNARTATAPQTAAVNTAPTYITFKAQHAVDAAEIGDKVEPSALTIVCSNEDDAFKVLYAGKVAMSEYRRLGGSSSWDAVKIKHAAHKEALRYAYSCTLVRHYSAAPLLVEQKRLVGQPGDLFRTVTYGLRNEQGLWFVKVEQNGISPFEPVKRLKISAPLDIRSDYDKR